MFPRSQGEESIETLQYFIKELEQGNKDLTKNQNMNLKAVAKELIFSIETELNGELRKKRGINN